MPSADSGIWKAEIWASYIIPCPSTSSFLKKSTSRVDNGRLFGQGKEIKGKDTNSSGGYSAWLACCELNSLTPVKPAEWAVGTAAPSAPPSPIRLSPAHQGGCFPRFPAPWRALHPTSCLEGMFSPADLAAVGWPWGMADLCVPSLCCSLLMAVGKRGGRDYSRLLLDAKRSRKDKQTAPVEANPAVLFMAPS